MNWYLSVLQNYANFQGRARRKEYWLFLLFNIVFIILAQLLDKLIGSRGFIALVYGLAVFIPSLAVAVRRLHDTERSGWWLLLVFVPLVGPIVLLIFALLEGTPGQNAYGDDPKA